MQLRTFFLAACFCVGPFLCGPSPVRAGDFEETTPHLQSAAEARGDGSLASPAWWREKKKRFHQLALCALASGNVTYTLLVGFSGVGAAIGFTAALLGVVMCL